MSATRVSPAEALRLIGEEGYVYVDVRSVPEFEAGHPAGAYNVPLMHMAAGGMRPNTDFVPVIEAVFPRDAKLVVGCKAGQRSLRAVAMLQQAGYTALVDQRAGFAGATDPFGRVTEPGWHPAGLPTATRPEPGRSWADLSARRA